MSGKYIAAREQLGAGSLSWTGERILAQLVSDAYQFDERHHSAADLTGKIGEPVELTGKSVSGGWAHCANLEFRQVRADRDAVALVVYRAGSKSRPATLIVHLDQIDSFPLRPNGGNILLEVSADQGLFRF